MSVRLFLLASAVFTAVPADAFYPPVDEQRTGVSLAFIGFDESTDKPGLHVREVDASRPLVVRLAATNTRHEAVSGPLRVYLNDDWTVDRSALPEVLSLGPGEGRSLSVTARAGKRVLPALYPIHAVWDFKTSARRVKLHPVAVFSARAPQRRAPAAPKAVVTALMPASDEPEKSALTGKFDVGCGDARVVYDGFICEVDGRRVGRDVPVLRVTTEPGDVWNVTHWVSVPSADAPVPLRSRARLEDGALKVTWDMPGVVRNFRGEPRYTAVSVGGGSLHPARVYAGFGNVLESPGTFDLRAWGFGSSTRHVGADYPNGLSVVQATDVFPDYLTCRKAERRFSLVAKHDPTFVFLAGTNGAFAAARRFRDISGYRAGPGVHRLFGRVGLIERNGPYVAAAGDIARAARYGLTDAVFFYHQWQCWGYDYRYPDIWPPHGSQGHFREMRAAAKRAGMLFLPHDNYTDIYPDSTGYTYDNVAFSADGVPVKAWFNKGPRAQSYKWNPSAFASVQRRNIGDMRNDFSPDGVFTDVLTAENPMDYYDRDGNFHTSEETRRHWAASFDRARGILGADALAVSEAGHDALVGHVDGAQNGHFAVCHWMEPSCYADAERVPWHDIVMHGKMVLFGGGIDAYYDSPAWNVPGRPGHGYGSDDYFCTTVIGGRAPLAGKPASREAVLTYWMLRDVSADLSRASFDAFSFGPSIRQQHAVFSGGCDVWINRATNGVVWTVADGRKLGSYGFYVRTPRSVAGVMLDAGGSPFAFARSASATFLDARRTDGSLVRRNGFGTDRACRLETPAAGDWRVVPLPSAGAFRARIDLARFSRSGRTVADVVPEALTDGAGAPPDVVWRQKGDVVAIASPSSDFACRIVFR